MSKRGCDISADEIFISDGAKCDSGNIQEIFSKDNKIAVCDPVYPVYVDTNVMAGRTGVYDAKTEMWSDVIYMPCTAENGFASLHRCKAISCDYCSNSSITDCKCMGIGNDRITI